MTVISLLNMFPIDSDSHVFGNDPVILNKMMDVAHQGNGDNK